MNGLHTVYAIVSLRDVYMYYTSALSFYFLENMINISTGIILPSPDLVWQKVDTVA